MVGHGRASLSVLYSCGDLNRSQVEVEVEVKSNKHTHAHAHLTLAGKASGLQTALSNEAIARVVAECLSL